MPHQCDHGDRQQAQKGAAPADDGAEVAAHRRSNDGGQRVAAVDNGIVAAVVYAIPPGIRLTSLGIRQVNYESLEAATTFGATPRQVLWGVRVPLAMPSIILAINQMVMMVLAMAIIAGMVGGGGLGYRSIEALTKPDAGLGAEVGTAIVIMATILDRLLQATAKRLQAPAAN